MSTALQTVTKSLAPATIEKVLLGGNLKDLKPEERLSYYNNLCESLEFNPLTRPFDYVEFQGKLVLYTNKGGGEQLRVIRKVSINITSREKIGDVYVVTARAKLPDGREDEATGAVNITNLKGDALANAYMKAETKAKRRVTLSICGLNMLDDSEVDTVDGAKRVSHDDVARMPAATIVDQLSAKPAPIPKQENIESPWDYIVRCGNKYRGEPLRNIDTQEISSFMKWIKTESAPGFRDSDLAKEFIFYAELALKTPRGPRDDDPNDLDQTLDADFSDDFSGGGK